MGLPLPLALLLAVTGVLLESTGSSGYSMRVCRMQLSLECREPVQCDGRGVIDCRQQPHLHHDKQVLNAAATLFYEDLKPILRRKLSLLNGTELLNHLSGSDTDTAEGPAFEHNSKESISGTETSSLLDPDEKTSIINSGGVPNILDSLQGAAVETTSKSTDGENLKLTGHGTRSTDDSPELGFMEKETYFIGTLAPLKRNETLQTDQREPNTTQQEVEAASSDLAADVLQQQLVEDAERVFGNEEVTTDNLTDLQDAENEHSAQDGASSNSSWDRVNTQEKDLTEYNTHSEVDEFQPRTEKQNRSSTNRPRFENETVLAVSNRDQDQSKFPLNNDTLNRDGASEFDPGKTETVNITINQASDVTSKNTRGNMGQGDQSSGSSTSTDDGNMLPIDVRGEHVVDFPSDKDGFVIATDRSDNVPDGGNWDYNRQRTVSKGTGELLHRNTPDKLTFDIDNHADPSSRPHQMLPYPYPEKWTEINSNLTKFIKYTQLRKSAVGDNFVALKASENGALNADDSVCDGCRRGHGKSLDDSPVTWLKTSNTDGLPLAGPSGTLKLRSLQENQEYLEGQKEPPPGLIQSTIDSLSEEHISSNKRTGRSDKFIKPLALISPPDRRTETRRVVKFAAAESGLGLQTQEEEVTRGSPNRSNESVEDHTKNSNSSAQYEKQMTSDWGFSTDGSEGTGGIPTTASTGEGNSTGVQEYQDVAEKLAPKATVSVVRVDPLPAIKPSPLFTQLNLLLKCLIRLALQDEDFKMYSKNMVEQLVVNETGFPQLPVAVSRPGSCTVYNMTCGRENETLPLLSQCSGLSPVVCLDYSRDIHRLIMIREGGTALVATMFVCCPLAMIICRKRLNRVDAEVAELPLPEYPKTPPTDVAAN